MVKDTKYYDILGVEPTATDIELKKAYRKQAIKLHPDKNGNDPAAAEKFQELGEAYGILSNSDSRATYDQIGVEGMKDGNLSTGAVDVDPAEFFTMIFGGDSFKDWIGELSMLNELSKSAEILNEDESEEADSSVIESEKASDVTDVAIKDNHASVDKPTNNNNTLSTEAINKKKKQKINQEQREKIMKLHEEAKQAKLERIHTLAEKLLTRIEKYQSTSTNSDSFNQFKVKLKEELEDLKIESFGIQLLHLIGKVYVNQANATIQSLKTFGFSKIITTVKSKSTTVKNGYSILKTALDAQSSVEEMVKEQEALQAAVESGAEISQAEKYRQAEIERLITGKFLATAWASTRFEVTGVLNKVCIEVLNDKSLSKKQRLARAEAVLFIGKELKSVERSAEEDEEARIFEEMMADATAKKSSKKKSNLNSAEIDAYMRKVAEENAAEETEAA